MKERVREVMGNRLTSAFSDMLEGTTSVKNSSSSTYITANIATGMFLEISSSTVIFISNQEAQTLSQTLICTFSLSSRNK